MDAKDRQFQKKLLSTFKVEAEEHVRALSSGLIELERSVPVERRTEVLENVFRQAHSLKGAARAVGVTPIETVCQALESVFAAVKQGKLEYSPTLFDVLHDAVDALHKGLSHVASEASDKLPTADLLRRLDAILMAVGASSAKATPHRTESALAQSERLSASTPAADRAIISDTVRIPAARLDALLFQAEGLLASKLTSAQRAAEIREAVGSLVDLKKERSRLMSGMQTASGGGADRSDAQLSRLIEWMSREGAFIRSFEARMSALAKCAEDDHRALAAMVGGLLEDTKKALMLPVASILEVLPKLARDLSRAQGKEVELAVQGGDIEVDRRILDEMRDPLIHLVRNCLDHGIEAPAVRATKGKPPTGGITFTITHKEGGRIEILVADDGAGINLAKVQEAALKLGLIAATGGLDPQNALSLVFQSGVSTNPIITDISGRGLGLAIVREKVEKLGGLISVETQPGRGTRFRIVLPLTLSTFRGVRVRVNDQQFVVPTTHVEQAVRVGRDVIKTVENRATIQWQGQPIALVRLADVLELPTRASGDQADTVQLLLLASADKRIGFGVDEIIEEQEVLVKSLGKQLGRVRNVAGATVLGTGKAVPILDVPDLLRSAVRITAVARAEAPQIEAKVKSILVVEDSVTSRALLKNILESAGYDVSTAVDGADAFSRLKVDSYDLVVSDVEMPRMSGFDLAARIRADKALAELPIVLVTALESREDREHGIDVGANAYIVKSSFDQSNLVDVIRRLI
jgi:two-component system, chemotaxis family, sensor kinase CheA